jgi:hypothetical protein
MCLLGCDYGKNYTNTDAQRKMIVKLIDIDARPVIFLNFQSSTAKWVAGKRDSPVDVKWKF